MIKDIAVNLGIGERLGHVGDYAVSMAATFDAHIAGIAFVYDPILPLSIAGYLPAEQAEKLQRDTVAATQAAVDRFAAASARVGVSAEPLKLGTGLASASDQFGRIARRFDLSIVGQAEPETSGVERMIIEAALFESGRPVIVVPYIQKGPFKLERVMVCWDGSRAATRAIADAMPLLERAGRVEVVVIADERGKQHEIVGADMGQHLARHGLDVEAERIVAGDVDVADMLLSHAADADTDFIVMGGYGHARLREFVLGGATRNILRSMTAPVLMSH